MHTWSYADETVLLKTVAKHRPLGEHKNAHLASIVRALNAVLPSAVTRKDVNDRLEALYDMDGLEELGSSADEAAGSAAVSVSRSSRSPQAPAVDKSDSDGSSSNSNSNSSNSSSNEDDDDAEDDKHEEKRTVLTRSSTRRQTPETDGGSEGKPAEDTQQAPRVRKSSRSSRYRGSTPARTSASEKEESKEPAESSDAVSDSEPTPEAEKEEAQAPSVATRKRTRSFVQATPLPKSLKASSAATPSTRRSTRFSGPVVEATPSKPTTRTSVRKSGSTRPTPATPGNTNSAAANTPATSRRRSTRKK